MWRSLACSTRIPASPIALILLRKSFRRVNMQRACRFELELLLTLGQKSAGRPTRPQRCSLTLQAFEELSKPSAIFDVRCGFPAGFAIVKPASAVFARSACQKHLTADALAVLANALFCRRLPSLPVCSRVFPTFPAISDNQHRCDPAYCRWARARFTKTACRICEGVPPSRPLDELSYFSSALYHS